MAGQIITIPSTNTNDERDIRSYRQSCNPNLMPTPTILPDGKKASVDFVTTRVIWPGDEYTIPHTTQFRRFTEPLTCAEHSDNIDLCPREQERRRFQMLFTDEAKYIRSCDPNCELKEIIQPDGSVKKEMVAKGFLSIDDTATIPFLKDSKKSEVELACFKHKGNINACPKEKERKQWNAQRAKMQKAQGRKVKKNQKK